MQKGYVVEVVFDTSDVHSIMNSGFPFFLFLLVCPDGDTFIDSPMLTWLGLLS